MKRLLCWLFGHVPATHVDPAMSLVIHCERCHALVPGGLAYRRARR